MLHVMTAVMNLDNRDMFLRTLKAFKKKHLSKETYFLQAFHQKPSGVWEAAASKCYAWRAISFNQDMKFCILSRN